MYSRMFNHTQNLRLLARLLEYPGATLWNAREEIATELASLERLPEPLRQALKDFADTLMRTDLLDAQASYIDTFEYGRSTSLLLFEHVYGESRERGQAMVDLQETYRQSGLNLHSRELPDYLPLYLEYLSTLSEEEAKKRLGQFEAVLSRLSVRLQQRENSYAFLFDALLAFCGVQIDEDARMTQAGNELPDNTPAAIDAVWQETQVCFGAPSPCGTGAAQSLQQPVLWKREKRSPFSPVKH